MSYIIIQGTHYQGHDMEPFNSQIYLADCLDSIGISIVY